MIEHFRDVWLSTERQRALRKAITKVTTRKANDRPSEIAALQQRLDALEAQIAKGKQNLLLVDAEDMPDLKRFLSGWKDDRAAIEKQLASQAQPASEPEVDADELIEELHHLEQHLAGNESVLARGIPTHLQERDVVLEPQWTPLRRHRASGGRTAPSSRTNGDSVDQKQGA